MEEFIKKMNFKTIGNFGVIISVAIITYYGLQSFKTYLEIKKLKSEK
jgi:hypothetical protein